jgi:hypothetical protein
MQELFPAIDHTVPVPQRGQLKLPDMSPAAEMRIRAATAKRIAELSGLPLVVATTQPQASVTGNELPQLKLYIVNKLIYEVENGAAAKDRISALAKLGEIDGVDAFKKRNETTYLVKPIAEVEKELLNVLHSIEYTVVEATNSSALLENSLANDDTGYSDSSEPQEEIEDGELIDE